MDNRFKTIAGSTVLAGLVALGLNSISARYFHADKARRPAVMGYAIPGVVEDSAGNAPVPLATRLASADLARGKATFAKCASCHTIAPGAPNGTGPNLHGVVGEAVGQGKAGFAFSPALRKLGGTWTFARLDRWLESPRAFAPGTRMTFAGLSSPEDRANVIVYLNSQGSNLPLPPLPGPSDSPTARSRSR